MAIEKKIKMADGVEVTYWKIAGFQFLDYEAKTAVVWLKGWVSKQNRDDGSNDVSSALKKVTIPIEWFNGYLDDTSLATSGNSLLSQAYNAIKGIVNSEDEILDELKGCVDV
jgi:hypothetical protein